MNSQFKNSKLGTWLYAFIIFTFVIATILIFWFMLVGYKQGTYPEDTILGSVYLGGLQEEQVNSKIERKYVDWLDDETIVYELTYQGYSYEFDRELFSFNIDLSMEYLVEGQTNELFVQYQALGTDRQDTIDEISALPFLSDVIDNVDIESLINDVLADAGLMKTYSLKRVEDYFIDPSASEVVISSYTIDLPIGVDGNNIVNNVVALYGDEYIDVPSKELFDVVDVFGDVLSDQEMTILSRSILKQIVSTNFNITEIHYNPDYDYEPVNQATYEFKGANTVVDALSGDSFSFYNPNDSDYRFKVEYDLANNQVIVSLVGLDFVNTITVTTHEEIIEYITKVSNDIEKPGYDGLIYIVHRTITTLDNDVIFDQDIIFEFYPPVVEIVNNN